MTIENSERGGRPKSKGESDRQSSRSFFLFRWLRQIWDWDPGEIPCTSPLLGVASASGGLFVALCVGAVVLLKERGFFRIVWEFIEGSMAAAFEVSGIAAVLWTCILIVTVIAGISLIGGMAIFYSSSKRSYLGHAWRGALVPVCGIFLFAVGAKFNPIIKPTG